MSSKLIIHGLHYKLIVLRSVGLRSENSTLSLLRSLQMRIKVADKFALPRRYRHVKGSWYFKRLKDGNVASRSGHEGKRKSAHGRMKSLAGITVADPGEGPRRARPPPPLFSDQTEARRADWRLPLPSPPPSQGMGDRPTPHPLIWRSGSAIALLMFVFKKHCL